MLHTGAVRRMAVQVTASTNLGKIKETITKQLAAFVQCSRRYAVGSRSIDGRVDFRSALRVKSRLPWGFSRFFLPRTLYVGDLALDDDSQRRTNKHFIGRKRVRLAARATGSSYFGTVKRVRGEPCCPPL
jgi:hypothetical protein